MTTPQRKLVMSNLSATIDELEQLIAAATDEDLTDDGRYFADSFQDLTQCGHGDTGEYQCRKDGKLIELLWNNRRQILEMMREQVSA